VEKERQSQSEAGYCSQLLQLGQQDE